MVKKFGNWENPKKSQKIEFFEKVLSDTRFYLWFVQKWRFLCLERDFSKYFLFWCQLSEVVSDLPISNFFINTTIEDNLSSISYLLRLYSVHLSTMWTQTKWSQPLWLTNDKASYVAVKRCQRSNLEQTMDNTWCPFWKRNLPKKSAILFSFPILRGHDLTRAFQSSPLQNPEGSPERDRGRKSSCLI